MFQATDSLPALLSPQHYTCPSHYENDSRVLRQQVWQLVATTDMLPNVGDYVTVDRLGVPLLLRNEADGFYAYRNVCAHRHCRLATGHGNSPQIKCPYHGWQYGSDGRTRKIPGAKNFPHFDRESYRLDRYRVKQIGQLLLVHLGLPVDTTSSQDGTTVEDWTQWADEFGNRCDAIRWRQIITAHYDFECDWKIPIEGALEGYHIDEVHAKTFGHAPSEQASDHQLHPSGTVFQTQSNGETFLIRLEARLIEKMTGSFDSTYRHVHVFPNVMASFTDSVSVVYQIYPTAHRRSRMTVFGFMRRSERMGWLGKYLSWCMGVAAKRAVRKVMQEDAAIFPEVQAGMEAATSTRLFGRCEERLHAFQSHWQDAMEKPQ